MNLYLNIISIQLEIALIQQIRELQFIGKVSSTEVQTGYLCYTDNNK